MFDRSRADYSHPFLHFTWVLSLILVDCRTRLPDCRLEYRLRPGIGCREQSDCGQNCNERRRPITVPCGGRQRLIARTAGCGYSNVLPQPSHQSHDLHLYHWSGSMPPPACSPSMSIGIVLCVCCAWRICHAIRIRVTILVNPFRDGVQTFSAACSSRAPSSDSRNSTNSGSASL